MELKIFIYIKDGVSLTFLAVMQCLFKIFCRVAVFKDPMSPSKKAKSLRWERAFFSDPLCFCTCLVHLCSFP